MKNQKSPKAKAGAPGEGERRAQRGFQNQYKVSAALIYSALLHNRLNWIGVADRSAGILDDLVLGLDGRVVGHQFKSSKFPTSFNFSHFDDRLRGASAKASSRVDIITPAVSFRSHPNPFFYNRFS
jgi:hypothetical protein